MLMAAAFGKCFLCIRSNSGYLDTVNGLGLLNNEAYTKFFK